MLSNATTMAIFGGLTPHMKREKSSTHHEDEDGHDRADTKHGGRRRPRALRIAPFDSGWSITPRRVQISYTHPTFWALECDFVLFVVVCIHVFGRNTSCF